jgi:hypothetical protein
MSDPNQQPQPHSKDDEAADTVEHDERHRRHDELLDEGVEETFPASDPVAVKHIT